MSRITRYRSLMLAASAALIAAGCQAQATHKTQKAEANDRWNATVAAVKIQLAQQQYAVGDYDKCRKTIDEGFALDPKNAKLHLLAGKVDLEKGQLDSSAEHLKVALLNAPSDPEPFYLLGVVFQRWQRYDLACENYQLAWDKKTTEGRYMLAVVEMKITMGQLDEAQQILEDKLQYFEQTGAVRIALARIAAIKGDYPAACKYYRDAVVLLPEDENLKRTYAETLFMAGKYADAAPLLQDILQKLEDAQLQKRAPNAAGKVPPLPDRQPVLLMLGQTYLSLHRVNEARSCYQQITRDTPDDIQALLGLGKVAIQVSDLTGAAAVARKVLQREPGNIEGLILTAVVQQKQKKWDESLTTLDVATHLAPRNSTILCLRGVGEQQLGRKDQAIDLFAKAVAYNPKDAWAVELLGRAKPVSLSTAVEPTNRQEVLPDIRPETVRPIEPRETPEAPQKPLEPQSTNRPEIESQGQSDLQPANPDRMPEKGGEAIPDSGASGGDRPATPAVKSQGDGR